MSAMMDEVREAKLKEIRKRLTIEDLLIQLAEEASELSQAATRMLRGMRGHNLPKGTSLDISGKLVEEATDVFVCLELLGVEACTDVADHKISRWVERLEREDADIWKRYFEKGGKPLDFKAKNPKLG